MTEVEVRARQLSLESAGTSQGRRDGEDCEGQTWGRGWLPSVSSGGTGTSGTQCPGWAFTAHHGVWAPAALGGWRLEHHTTHGF